LNLEGNNIWTEWAKALAQAIEKAGWLKMWSILDISANNIWIYWKAALQKLKDDAEAKWIKCIINF
jgi:hypothetical protein